MIRPARRHGGEIGVKFKNNEVFVPEVLIAARAMNAGMEILKPRLVETGVKPRGNIVLGTVKGGFTRYRQEPGAHDV